jgi:hypothetical protein
MSSIRLTKVLGAAERLARRATNRADDLVSVP